MTPLEESHIAPEVTEKLEAVERTYLYLAQVADTHGGITVESFNILLGHCAGLVDALIENGEDMQTISPLISEIGLRNNLNLNILNSALMQAQDSHLNGLKKTARKPISPPNSRKIYEIKKVVESRSKPNKTTAVVDLLTDIFIAESNLDIELLMRQLQRIFEGTPFEDLTFQLVHQAQYDAILEINRNRSHIIPTIDEETGRVYYFVDKVIEGNN